MSTCLTRAGRREILSERAGVPSAGTQRPSHISPLTGAPMTTHRRLLAVATSAAVVALAACGDDPAAPALDCTGGVPLAVGATVNGTLEEGDALDIDGAYLDRFALAVTSDRTVTITMRSPELDSFLWLRTAGGAVITTNDDGGGGVNGLDARIVRDLERECYLVEATTFPGQTGAYTLTVQ